MKNGITQTYINFVQSCTRAVVGHFYQFTSVAGVNDYFTDLDASITWNGQLWKGNGLRIDGFRRKVGVGIQIDEQEIKIWSLPGDTLFGGNFLRGAEEGVLDGCMITRYRAVWNLATGNVAYDVLNNAPLQVWTMFKGYCSAIMKGGRTHVEMKVRSPLALLSINMPRNYYQPGCLWNLFDSGCTLNAATYQFTGTVAAGVALSNSQVAVSGGVPNPTGGDGFPNYAQGKIQFTGGANAGLVTLIDSNDATNLYLAYTLDNVISPGDTFVVYPGCSKLFSTCQNKFNNTQNFRGYDLVPPVFISL